MMHNLSKIFIHKSGRVAELQLESNKPSSYSCIPPKLPPEFFKNSDDFFQSAYFSKGKKLSREMETQAQTEAGARGAVPVSTVHRGENELSRVRAG